MHSPAQRWWESGIVYQVYPRSFQDLNGDGVGDLRGITSRLDYLQWLGVDAIWISPIYPSPMVDFGYDISDYTNIHPMFGTLDDFDELMARAHEREIRVLLDYVPNHTSDQHPWFIESRSSKHNPKRDFYIWRDPAPDGGPPNNWLSHFGGSAWEFDEESGQYYLHSFLKQQPDLNWRNAKVRAEMLDVLRFWLDRGVDGFRVDVLYQVIKDDEFRDDPPNPDWVPSLGPYNQHLHVFSMDRPEVHDVAGLMRRVLDSYGERVFIAEVWLPLERLVAYYGVDCCGTHLPLNFQLIQLPWTAPQIRDAIDTYESLLPMGGWPNWVLGNHDTQRLASRIGPAQTRVAAMLLLTLRGTPTLYYGDEIGMTDVPIAPEQVQDPFEKNVPGLGLGRDPARTPMQWDGSPNAGFTGELPWLPLADDYPERNVATQRKDEHSLLCLYQALIQLRRDEPALSLGSYEEHDGGGRTLSWIRGFEGKRFLIALNLAHEPESIDLCGLTGTLRLTTELERPDTRCEGAVGLHPNQGVIVELD
jgi:alpha-glucosidase